ncbi:MAG: hypothetical protein IJI47_01290 [Eubacterium sp.]|nr:hypothetical protein [Eubacterium sp.]
MSSKQDGGFSSRGQKPHWGFFLFLLSSESCTAKIEARFSSTSAMKKN